MENSCSDSIVHHAWRELTSEDKRYAATYLNETDETRENAIAEIRRWIEENDNLPAQIDDFFILQFLRVCKFNLEKSKLRIQNYYKQRFRLPEWYMNKDPFRSELQELLNLGVFFALREPDNQGRLVILVRGTQHDPKRHKISDICKIGVIVTELAMKYYPATSVRGCAVFIDVANPTMRHAMQMRPQIIMNLVHAWQSSYPLRLKSINIINAPDYIDIVVRIFRSFMTEKMRNRFHVYTPRTMQHCFKDIPTNILPVEYGGTNDTLQELTEYWKKLVEENRDWITEDDQVVLKQ